MMQYWARFPNAVMIGVYFPIGFPEDYKCVAMEIRDSSIEGLELARIAILDWTAKGKPFRPKLYLGAALQGTSFKQATRSDSNPRANANRSIEH